MAAIKSFNDFRLLSTQNINHELSDIFAAGTAVATGVKTLDGSTGVNLDGRPV